MKKVILRLSHDEFASRSPYFYASDMKTIRIDLSKGQHETLGNPKQIFCVLYAPESEEDVHEIYRKVADGEL